MVTGVENAGGAGCGVERAGGVVVFGCVTDAGSEPPSLPSLSAITPEKQAVGLLQLLIGLA